ncbi:MAG: lasso peptide biosynthesis B2 protein [Halobacteriota archaeon]|jgi:hypothetical protein
MSKAIRFLSLTSAEQRRLVRAFLIVVGVRIGLSLVPFPRFQALLARLRARASVKSGVVPTTEQLAQDVLVVSSYVPRATCLTRALAGQVLLAHHRYPTTVHIGVTKEEGKGTFQAHAWLESEGKVIIGESEVAYVPLTTEGNAAVL